MIQSSRNSLFVCLLLALLPWSATSVDISLLDTTGHITGLSGSDDSAATNAVAPPQLPKCWLEALKVFQPSNEYDVATTTQMCEKLEPMQQKALAFELARCHLQDLGRKMIESAAGEHIGDLQDCVALVYDASKEDEDVVKGSSFPNLPKCLTSLTDHGANAYTHFLAQVVSLCNRLTQHMFIGFQRHTSMQLAKISHQTIELFTNTIQRQQEAFYEREAEMRKQHEHFYKSLQKNQEALRKDEASRMDAFKTWTSGLLNSWKLRDQEQMEQHDAWFQNLTQTWKEQTVAMEQQYLKNFATVNSFIQPFLSMDSWMTLAAKAYRLLAITSHSIFLLLICWFFTRPRWCRRIRGALLVLVLMEMLAEICVHFLVNDLVSKDQKDAMVASLRNTAMSVEILVYVLGLVLSCCWCPWGGDDGDSYDRNDGYDDIDEGEAIVNHRQQMRTEFRHLMAETRHQTDPLPFAAVGASVALDAPTGTTGTTPLESRSTAQTVHSRLPPSPQPVPTANMAAGAAGIFRAKYTPATGGFSNFGQVNIAASTEGSLAATDVIGTGKASLPHDTGVRNLTFSSNEELDTTAVKAIPPVTGLVPDVAQNSTVTQSGHFAEWRKKRSSEETHLSDDSDSDVSAAAAAAAAADNGSSCPSSSSGKRRRVETATEAMEEEYHTAAEEDDDSEHPSDEEDSTMADEAEDEEKAEAAKMEE